MFSNREILYAKKKINKTFHILYHVYAAIIPIFLLCAVDRANQIQYFQNGCRPRRSIAVAARSTAINIVTLTAIWNAYMYDRILGQQLRVQYNFNGSNTDGSFSTAVSNSFSSPLTKNHPAADLGLIRVIFVFKLKMVYCVFSLESPRWGDSNENTQHTFMLKKWKIIPILPPDLELWLTLIRSNYPCLEHNFIVPKVFEPFSFTVFCWKHKFTNCYYPRLTVIILGSPTGT